MMRGLRNWGLCLHMLLLRHSNLLRFRDLLYCFRQMLHCFRLGLVLRRRLFLLLGGGLFHNCCGLRFLVMLLYGGWLFLNLLIVLLWLWLLMLYLLLLLFRR